MSSEMLHSTTEAQVIGGSKAGVALGVEECGTKIMRSDEIDLLASPEGRTWWI